MTLKKSINQKDSIEKIESTDEISLESTIIINLKIEKSKLERFDQK